MSKACRYALLVLLMTPQFLFASELGQLLTESQKPIILEGQKLSGPGAQDLIQEAESSLFLSVGEFHHNQETPAFLEALLNTSENANYDYFAVETGPYSAQYLQAMVNRGDGAAEAIRFFDQFPQSIAFFDIEEEFALLNRFTTKAGEVDKVWGLDQEFLFSARFLLSELDSLVVNPEAKGFILELIESSNRGFATYLEEDRYDQLLLSTIEPTEFEKLKRLLGREYVGQVKLIVDELEASRAIYLAYSDERYYENNALRIELFKANFIRNLNLTTDQNGTEPNVLIKMGLYHAGRGRSPVGHFDIGNFVSELAISKGKESFHIAIIAPVEIEAEERKDLTEQFAAMAPFIEATQGDQIAYFDLLRIRKNLNRAMRSELSPDAMNLIFAYDAIVVLPEFHPSKKIGAE